MRIRSIKPEFWRSEDVTSLPWETRLVFIGLWSYVDDNGVGRADERLILADLFPLDECLTESSVRIHEGLKQLESRGMISRYTVSGRQFLHVTAWSAHQKINRPSPGRYPLPTSADAVTHEPLTEDSVSPHVPDQGAVDQGAVDQGAVERESAPRKRAPAADRGTRLPENWKPADSTLTAMRNEFPDIDLRQEHAKFADHWASQPGAKGRKSDWDATWRNWIRRSAESFRPRPVSVPGAVSRGDQKVMDTFSRGEELKRRLAANQAIIPSQREIAL